MKSTNDVEYSIYLDSCPDDIVEVPAKAGDDPREDESKEDVPRKEGNDS